MSGPFVNGALPMRWEFDTLLNELSASAGERNGEYPAARASVLRAFDAQAARIAELEAEHANTPAEALPLIVRYRNWKGETRERRIFPVGVRWAANQWHPERKWLLDAVDAETGKTKTFSFDGFLPTNEGNAASRLRIAQQFENEAQREYEASPEYPAGPHPAIAAGNRVLARWEAAAKGSVEP